MLIDKTTEAIAHFIGLFDMTDEQARARKAYDEFKALERYQDDLDALVSHRVNIKVGYDFVGFDPAIPYVPVVHGVVPFKPWLDTGYYAPYTPVYVPPGSVHISSHVSAGGAAGSGLMMPPIQPPGSILVYVDQKIWLADSDYVGAGGHGLHFDAPVNDGADLAALIAAAEAIQPLSALTDVPLGSTEEMKTFVDTAADILRNYEPDANGDADITVVKEVAIEGKFVNGELVDEIPVLKDYLPKDDDDDEDEEEEETDDDSFEYGGNDGDSPADTPNTASGEHAEGTGNIEIEVSVKLEAGGNTLVNEVVVTNDTTSCHVMAVVGDHVELNAIIQINAYCDTDAVTSALAGWGKDGPDVTQTFNIAEFERVDPSADDTATVGGFPQAWVVTKVEGDLIIANWVEQYSFMTDNDVAVLSSSGVKTVVTTGDNTAVNEISLYELDHYYDLIIVGGCVYDANMIMQMNILIDNDLIGAVEDFETSGPGTVSTQDNLLWNQASIVNYGGADRFEALPEHYAEAAANFAAGRDKLNGEIMNDPAFAGMAGLRVLYISGDFVNLTYVKQTNVLGDSDQVALAMHALQAQPDAAWTLETGANALINFAGIADVDVTGTTYVGGGVYSDEILIQADLISSAPDWGAQNPDVLVNEAIVFLDDDMAAATTTADGHAIGPIAPDPTYADPMQNVLA